MKKIAIFLAVLAAAVFCSLAASAAKVDAEKMLNRFLSYATVESASVDVPDMEAFPMTEGQQRLARLVYDELLSFGGKDVKVTLSDDYYVYVDIPANVKQSVPSILLMAHLDVTPEAPGVGIKPMVHRNYDGGAIALPGGITLSPDIPQGAHLKDLVGKTIVTSDGTTLLGADDKTGTAVLVSLVEQLISNPKLKHGRVMVAFSQNEDVGKAALRYDPSVFGCRPDVVIDVDGNMPGRFSVGNFSAVGQSYLFHGKSAHPGHGKENGMTDALSAAAYFVGLVPPELNPSNREGNEGYVHCYTLYHPKKADGTTNDDDVVVKVRLRYFDRKEGAYQKRLMDDNLAKARQAWPRVEITPTDDQMQYENIAYTMPVFVPDLVQRAAATAGIAMEPQLERGGTTSAMMTARFPDLMPGGSCIYSGQQAEHSVYEWCCIEEMLQLVSLCENIVTELVALEHYALRVAPPIPDPVIEDSPAPEPAPLFESKATYAPVEPKMESDPHPTPEPVRMAADVMPEFPGGSEALKNFINKNINYPVMAAENGIDGTVFVRLVVEKDGSIGETRIARGVTKELDAEAIRVCKKLPKFKLGHENGEPCRVWYTIPVPFKLK